jgi:histidine triad (HIT) family protein
MLAVRTGGHPMNCPFCPSPELDAQVVFRNDLASFVQDDRHQGALKHSGVIVPLRAHGA